ncbi:MAG: DUF971 domain-containing protein [Acidobacteria bacterium]|nr:DUF971 domain-containing protein [Acidobacteriota bacterium]
MSDTAQRRGPAVEPREIMQESDAELRVTWGDGFACLYGAPLLRRACPCAQCVNEFTGQRMLKPETIADDLSIENVEIVGRYALTFRWSDGHDTGIYSFRYLRQLCEEEIKDVNRES